MSGEWVVHTDGSGTTGGPAGIAFVARRGGELIEDSLPLASATNQQAEILAAVYALHRLPAGSAVTVVSDSEYLVKGWNEYLPDWRSRGWRKRTGGTPKNTAHWRRLIEAAERHESPVTFSWTRGHAGTLDNERADVLAVLARQAAIAGALTPTCGVDMPEAEPLPGSHRYP